MDQLDQMMLEPQDLELLRSFQNLSPLLTAASEYKRAKDEEPQSKKSRLHDAAAGVAEPMHQAQALPALTKMLIQLALQHERQLQALHRQDSFVFFAQLNKQGCVPLLTQKTQQWKDQLQKATDPTQQPKQTLRTFLLHALLTELQGRIVRLSKSKPGEELWDAAVQNGMIHQDGTWPFQKWNRDKQALETSHKQPIPMVRVLKDLEPDARAADGQRPRGEIPCSQTAATGSPVAATSSSSSRRLVADSQWLESELPMGHVGPLGEGPHTDPEQTGTGPADSATTTFEQGQRQRQDEEPHQQEPPLTGTRLALCRSFEQLTMLNPGDICYANSAFLMLFMGPAFQSKLQGDRLGHSSSPFPIASDTVWTADLQLGTATVVSSPAFRLGRSRGAG